MNEDQFNALEAWIMAAARYLVRGDPWASEEMDRAREEAKQLLVEQEHDPLSYGDLTGFDG